MVMGLISLLMETNLLDSTAMVTQMVMDNISGTIKIRMQVLLRMGRKVGKVDGRNINHKKDNQQIPTKVNTRMI